MRLLIREVGSACGIWNSCSVSSLHLCASPCRRAVLSVSVCIPISIETVSVPRLRGYSIQCTLSPRVFKFPLFAQFDAPELYGLARASTFLFLYNIDSHISAANKTPNVHIQTPDHEQLGAWFILSDAFYWTLRTPNPPPSPQSPPAITQALKLEDSPHNYVPTRQRRHTRPPRTPPHASRTTPPSPPVSTPMSSRSTTEGSPIALAPRPRKVCSLMRVRRGIGFYLKAQEGKMCCWWGIALGQASRRSSPRSWAERGRR